jgi:MFS family permease
VYSKSYRRYVTTLITLVYVFNQLDRVVFDILMEPIARTFSLTDTQLGFVSGPALVFVYSFLGVPVARWADRSRRLTIMTTAIALWSVIATLTAIVSNFWQLATVRVGVGLGEAGFSAIAVSVIGDYEGDQDRARSLSNFMMAIPIAVLISDLMGGWVNQLYGWRPVFLIAGLPGIALALMMRATVQEPPRRLGSSAEDQSRPPLRVVLATLWQRRSVRHLAIGQGLANIPCSVMGWSSVFFIRQHHMATGELGSWLAFTDGVGGLASMALSGFMATRFGAKDARVKTHQLAYAQLLVVPLVLFVLWSPSKHAALFGCLILNIPLNYYVAITAALVQDLVAASMRATMAAICFLIQMLASGFIGTQLVGALTDVLAPFAGNSVLALRWTMAMGAMATLWAAVHFWRAGKFIQHDLAAVHGVATGSDAFECADVPASS